MAIAQTDGVRQSEVPTYRVSVIIPTKDRPRELGDCLASLAVQTRRPDEIIVVDDGALDPDAVGAPLEGAAIALVYHRKQGVPGLTASRNIGVSLSSGNVVLFLDDDVVLDPEFITEILRVFETDAEGLIAGVSGVITNERPNTGELLYYLFCGIPSWSHGRVFPCGFNQCNYSRVKTVQSVQWLGGGTTAYRRVVLDEFRFHEGYKGYCLAEDLEFSFRVGQKYRLMITPHARMLHFSTPTDRVGPAELTRQQIVNFWYHFHHNVPQRPVNKMAFGWLLTAMLIVDVANLLLQAHRLPRMWARLCGHCRGLRECLTMGVVAATGPQTSEVPHGSD